MSQIPTFDPQQQRPQVPKHLEVVVNALDVTVRFELCGYPGSPATEIILKPGESAMVPRTFLEPIRGAGAARRESIMEMLTSMEAYPGGPRVQAVVAQADAAKTRERWEHLKATRPTVQTVMLSGQDGRAIPLNVPIPDAQPAPAAPKGKASKAAPAAQE